MKKICLMALVILMSGCSTPSSVDRDYRLAKVYDKRAADARDRGSEIEAAHFEAEAKKLRDHSTGELLMDFLFDEIFGESEKEPSRPTPF